MARVIMITSGKGGVGKTTVCANLGIALASLGTKVCMIDMDLGLKNLDVMMGCLLYTSKEFDLKLTLEHVTEGQFILPQLQAANVPLAVGPNLHANSTFEIRNMTFTTPGVLSKAGLQVSIVTDAPIVPLKYLAMSAGLDVYKRQPFIKRE